LTFHILLHGKEEVSVPEEESMRKMDFTSKMVCLKDSTACSPLPPYDYERHITSQKKSSPPLPPNLGQLVINEHSIVYSIGQLHRSITSLLLVIQNNLEKVFFEG
jgi:hypothetical protein